MHLGSAGEVGASPVALQYRLERPRQGGQVAVVDPPVVKLAVKDLPHSGKPAELLAAAGIDAAAIEQAARGLVRVKVS